MTCRLGSHGDAVRRIQSRLSALGFACGPADGVFGGATESAVKSFQARNGLEPDGIVGPVTWDALFPGTQAPAAGMLDLPVAQRCLALTGSFETGCAVPDCYCGLTGDFDGQGISFGVLQWNIGQGSLQPLLCEMLSRSPDVIANVFHDRLAELKAMLQQPLAAQLAWARSIQDRARVFEPWKGLFRALGRTPEFQAVELEHANQTYSRALAMCSQYGLASERAAALMFDICVQNGSISETVRRRIKTDFANVPAGVDVEVARMRIVANRRAEAARAAFVEDVRARKLTIAEGCGTVHGIPYDLEEQFALRLTPLGQ